jgi:hypothetical protein
MLCRCLTAYVAVSTGARERLTLRSYSVHCQTFFFSHNPIGSSPCPSCSSCLRLPHRLASDSVAPSSDSTYSPCPPSSPVRHLIAPLPTATPTLTALNPNLTPGVTVITLINPSSGTTAAPLLAHAVHAAPNLRHRL